MKEEEKSIHLPLFGLPRIFPYVRPYAGIGIAMVILGALASLADALYPLFNRYALNHFVVKNTLDKVWIFVILYLLVLGMQVLSNYFDMVLCGKMEMYLDRDLRNKAFDHLQKLSFSYFNQNSVGYIHARVISDTGLIGGLVAWRLMDLVWYGSYVLFVMISMLLINWRLALPVLALVPLAVVISFYFQKKLISLNRIVREMNSKITGDFNEGITGARAIRTLGIEKQLNQEFFTDTEKMRRTAVRTTRTSAFYTSSVTFLSAAALAIVLWKGGRITMDGVIEIGTLSVFLSYALDLLDPIQNIVKTISAMIGIQVNIERFSRLIATEPDVQDRDEIVRIYGDTFEARRENWEELRGSVDFEDVSFHYPDGKEMILEHFNLHVPQGTSVAIVGETGAGKSTLVNLVCRFYEPTSGRILIDGRDARDRSQLWLHSNIGYVLQSPHLFSGTVRENLRYGNPQATDEEIRKALHLVSADFVLDKLDQGLDSEVGEGGVSLSTGEKQLLSFARALLADPRLLILDEATSSIDTVTEKAIQDAIRTVTRGRTSFMIAHRLSTIVEADIILVVEDGKIIEQGTHAGLMKQHGAYYELYTRQYDEMETLKELQ